MQKISFILDLVKTSYEQETERLKRINQKADNLTKYVSIYLVMLNIVVPLIIKGDIIMTISPWLCYLLTIVPAVISLIIAVVIQAFDKVSLFPLGYDLEKDLIDNPSEFNSDIKIESKQIALYDDIICKMDKNSSIKIGFVIFAYVCYVLSIIALAGFILSFLIQL